MAGWRVVMVVAARSSGVCQKLELFCQVAIAGQLWHVTPVSDGCVTLPLIVRQLTLISAQSRSPEVYTQIGLEACLP
ncbi:hypothetical protein DTO212C5_2838 [Paecilomyces variotii]|nr:hypothetical protein DTO212C5_2838 [Paecilomyces variotii]